MIRQDHITAITDGLAFLSRKVEIANSVNLTDINVVAEDFYREFLNLLLGYDLVNINAICPNTVSIDLGDKGRRIAIQVTSTSDIAKTRKTVESFIRKKLDQDYDRLIILNLVKRSQHREKTIGEPGKFELDTRNDMWDYRDLAKTAMYLDSELLARVVAYLRGQLGLGEDARHPKEVITIITLVDHLSNYVGELPAPDLPDEPDPDRKIYKRFADHADVLTKRYVDLYAIYGQNLGVANSALDIGTVQFDKIALFLKSFSNRVLTECGGDPTTALERLTDHFAQVVGRKGVDYDRTAVEFYLVDQLIRCNVFPNPEDDDV